MIPLCTVHIRQDNREHGSTAVELAVLAPCVLLVLGLMVAGGRLVTTHAQVDQATTSAARAATLARSPTTARKAGMRTGHQTLSQQGLQCRPSEIQVDTSRSTTAPGQPGQVRVHAACTVPLGDLLVPGLPGSVRIPAEFSSPIDPYRGQP